jgi:hypothetical protein
MCSIKIAMKEIMHFWEWRNVVSGQDMLEQYSGSLVGSPATVYFNFLRFSITKEGVYVCVDEWIA